MPSHFRLVWFIVIAIVKSSPAFGAGSAIQFSVTLSSPLSYQSATLLPGRYLVTVPNRKGRCRLDFARISDDGTREEPVTAYGLCGADKDRMLKRPVIQVHEVGGADCTLIYFETPFEQPGQTFHVIVRLAG